LCGRSWHLFREARCWPCAPPRAARRRARAEDGRRDAATSRSRSRRACVQRDRACARMHDAAGRQARSLADSARPRRDDAERACRVAGV
jgi:hypothetical protein